jgi:hypothetical protein
VNRALRRYALLIGAAATAVALLALFLHQPAAPSAWLFAWFFCLGLPLGALAILCLHALTGGHWGLPLRPLLTAAARTFPWFLPLALPILVSLDTLYPWLHPGRENHAPWYLNRPFFLGRLALYYLLWLFFTRRAALAGTRMAAVATVSHGLLVTFASVDIVMSLQPGWFSTAFGLLIGTAEVLTTLAFCAVALRWIAPTGEVQDFHDLGNLLLTFVMLWAYIAFTQFLIIWYENIPREVAWYLPRLQGAWLAIAASLAVFQFALPFLLLLLRRTKRRLPHLAAVGLLLLCMRAADSYWTIVPAVRPHPSWLDPVALLAVGGLWLALFLFHLDRTAEVTHG